MKTIGNTNDEWAKELINFIPKNNKKTIILVSIFSQIFLTSFTKILGFKTIWLGTNSDNNKILNMLLKIISNFSDFIIVPNQNTEAKYLRIGIKSKKIHVIYPPCEQNTTTKPSKNNIVISCDGLITTDQGLGVLIQSINSVKEIIPNIKLIIGGKIADAQRINWIIKHLKLNNNVQILPTESKTWVASSHIYVLPTPENIPAPCSIIQAMMFSKAVIATDKLAHHEFIEQNKNGILIKQNNVDMLTQAIINLARNKEWVAKLGENNFKFAKQKFSIEVFEKKIQEILN